ncbi:Potassium voltage-gated channel subfamily H member 1 [Triplophysa tibetana]|uniref:Potassium voltage-gated channel subfamily H member 1 n=1 Tax=Triplophysa tibetana TaxID=1572043 RepID=A0A5A9NM47_9TELE|nr:Potassium voltage-gated channel subfamily H member 1 [Triplophysa tibetana]
MSFQLVFRKISDVKREEEERLRRKNEAPLNLPPDHPVRRLFQRFRQQKEARLATGQSISHDPDLEKGHIHNEVISQDVVTTTSIVTVTESPATPIPSHPNKKLTLGPFDQAKLSAPVPNVPRSSEPRVRGWGRFRESVAKPEGWGNVPKAESMETLPERSSSSKSCESSGLKKTDSCDSGITKSDLRLDEGGARTPVDRSPVQPDIKAPPKLLNPIIPEHTLHASLLELRSELKEELSALSNRMVALETQVAEVLRLLRSRKTSTSPISLFQGSSELSEGICDHPIETDFDLIKYDDSMA